LSVKLGKATGNGLDRSSDSVFHSVHAGYEAHPACYPTGTGDDIIIIIIITELQMGCPHDGSINTI
jgi:hypothetical protein